MTIKRIALRSMGVNCYVLSNEQTKEYLLIDPGMPEERLKDYLSSLEGYQPMGILLTHAHADHILGVNEIRELYPMEVYLQEADIEMAGNHKKNASYDIFRQKYEVKDVFPLQGDLPLSLGSFSFQVIHTPGHTKGSCCYLFGNDLFSGDTLFHRGIGRYDLFGGSETELMDSIHNKLYQLEGTVNVWPGHGPASTIQAEKDNNPFTSYKGRSY